MAKRDEPPTTTSPGANEPERLQSGAGEPDWKAEYEDLVRFLRASGTVPSQASPVSALKPQERRSEPRYSFNEGSKIFAHLGPKAFKIINIAIGGVAFYSDTFFESGTKLLLSALGMIALDVEILSCEMEEVDENLMEYRYRVRAKFGPRVNGYQVYVLAREMYMQQQGESGAVSLEPAAPKD